VGYLLLRDAAWRTKKWGAAYERDAQLGVDEGSVAGAQRHQHGLVLPCRRGASAAALAFRSERRPSYGTASYGTASLSHALGPHASLSVSSAAARNSSPRGTLSFGASPAASLRSRWLASTRGPTSAPAPPRAQRGVVARVGGEELRLEKCFGLCSEACCRVAAVAARHDSHGFEQRRRIHDRIRSAAASTTESEALNEATRCRDSCSAKGPRCDPRLTSPQATSAPQSASPAAPQSPKRRLLRSGLFV